MHTRENYWLIGGALTLSLAAAAASFAFVHAQAAKLQPISAQLGVGSSGQNVTTLQTLLATSPSLYPARLVTGYYGPLTKRAVTQFQIAYGLPAVGNVGPLTLTKLNALIENGTVAIDVDSPFISAVKVTPLTSGASITWTTNELATGKVHYDSVPIVMLEALTSKTEPQTSGTVLTEQVAGTSHTLTITGLQSGKTYYYSVESADLSQNVSVTIPSSFIAL